MANDGVFYLIARTGDRVMAATEKHNIYAIDDGVTTPAEIAAAAVPAVDASVSISPIKNLEMKFRRGITICSHESRIFVMGGMMPGLEDLPYDRWISCPDDMSQEMWYVDLDDVMKNAKTGVLSSNKKWINGPLMISPRFRAIAISYDGQVYVSGGLNETPGVNIEYFTIQNSTWHRLFPPIKDPIDQVVKAYARLDADGQPDPSMFMISARVGVVRQYHLLTGKLDQIDSHFFYDGQLPMPLINSIHVSGENNNVLVTYMRSGHLIGYNIDDDASNRCWLEIGGLDHEEWVVPKLEMEDWSVTQQIHLFPIGTNGKLCYIWGVFSDSIYYFYYTKFIVKVKPDGTLFAETEPSKAFQIKGAMELISCLTVDAKWKEPRGAEEEQLVMPNGQTRAGLKRADSCVAAKISELRLGDPIISSVAAKISLFNGYRK